MTNPARQSPLPAGMARVVIGCSAGGFAALSELFAGMPPGFAPPVLVVQHLHPDDNGSFVDHLARTSGRTVVAPCDKEPIEQGRVYVAPANYHMLVERDGTIALTVDEKVNWSRPSIDVLFENVARTWGTAVIAVLLSGASTDGSGGMLAVRKAGGITIAQDPGGAECPFMPRAAIAAGGAAEVLSLREMGVLFTGLVAGEAGNDRQTEQTRPPTDKEDEDDERKAENPDR